jgi:hypothetical protein
VGLEAVLELQLVLVLMLVLLVITVAVTVVAILLTLAVLIPATALVRMEIGSNSSKGDTVSTTRALRSSNASQCSATALSDDCTVVTLCCSCRCNKPLY